MPTHMEVKGCSSCAEGNIQEAVCTWVHKKKRGKKARGIFRVSDWEDSAMGQGVEKNV